MDILSDSQIEDYLNTLDLDANPDIKTVLMSLTPLSLDVFRQVMSGLAGGVLQVHDISQLPTVNDFTVNKLLGTKLASDDTYVLRNRYKIEIIPKLANFNLVKKNAMGNISDYINKILNEYTYLIKPKYNFVLSNNSGFYNFDEVIFFYNEVSNSPEVQTEVDNFITYFDSIKTQEPDMFSANSENCNICNLIRSTMSKPLFLQIQNGPYEDSTTPTLLWLLNNIFVTVIPENFENIMNDNYELMAQHNADDISLYGESGRVVLDVQQDTWTDIQDIKTKFLVDKARVNLYYLHFLYDNTDIVNDSKNKLDLLNEFLSTARETLWKIRNIINQKFEENYQE